MDRWILHADVDAFFASVEARDAPGLRGQPFVVAAEVVMCPSYPARARGVRSGMAVRAAQRLCPDLLVVPPRAWAYEQASQGFFTLLRRYAPVVEPGSIEEAFLALDTADPLVVGTNLRLAARAELGLPVSVGAGRTKLMAKLASRRAKPDGLVVIDPAQEQALRPTLRLADLWGVGATTGERLRASGLVTVADLAGLDVAMLAPIVGTGMARRLVAIAAGTDDASVRERRPRRAVSVQRTISPPTRARSTVHLVLSTVVSAALRRVTREGRPVRRIDVMARYDDGATVTARSGLPSGDDVESAALALLDGTGYESDGRGVTLVGVALSLGATPLPQAQQLALPLDV